MPRLYPPANVIAPEDKSPSLTAAFHAVIAALEPLSGAERSRILRATAIFLDCDDILKDP